MSILVTAFEPFENRKTNRSLLLLDSLNLTIDKKVLPVDAIKIYSAFEKLSVNKYDIVIMLGEANITNITLELVAKNQLDMRIKDNGGNQFRNQPILRDMPLNLRTNLPIDKLNLEQFDLSEDAGSFLCNMAYYLLLNEPGTCLKVFIHVPINHLDYKEIVEAFILEITKISNLW